MMKHAKFNDRKLKNKNLHKLVIILIIQIIVNSLSGYNNCYNNHFVRSSDKLLIVNCSTNYFLTVGLKIVEDSFHKFLLKIHNKIMHTRNGNRRVKKNKTHFNIYQINKGNSDFGTFCINLHEEIRNSKADLAIISEANYSEEDDSVYKNIFDNYNFEETYVDKCKKARLLVLVNKNINYVRLSQYENKYTSSIIINLKLSKRKTLSVVCLYRQWHLPCEAEVPDSGQLGNQITRLIKALEPIDDLRAKGHHILVGGDINIDHLVVNDPCKRWDIAKLTETLDDIRDRNQLEILNNLSKPTRFQRGHKPSLLDLFIASHPERVDGLEIVNSLLADHSAVQLKYHSKELKTNPAMIRIRDWRLVNANSLMKEIDSNENLGSIFKHTDPDVVANMIIEEMNLIVNKIAPAKLVQYKAKEVEYLNDETRDMKKESEERLTEAIKYNKNEDWNHYKNLRNRYRRMIKKGYDIAMKGILSRPKEMWRLVSNQVKADKVTTPKSIIDKGETITSTKKLAQIFDDHFVEKIEKMQSEFTHTDKDPIEILELLVEKPQDRFELKEISLKRTYEIINNMKTSKATGFDDVNSLVMKEIPHITSVWMTHLINCIVRKSRFPAVMKITRILPICKPKKNKMNKNNYRPISNLTVFEKVVEQYMKEELTSYLEKNKVILDEHHGGVKGKSTLTAKSIIDLKLDKAVDENKIGMLVSSDLSSAFDTVPAEILLEKLKYYGICERENNLLRSYLTGRTQFTQIEDKRSKVRNSLNCSVVQGGKLSGLLYLIYTNEIPRLHQLMKNKKWMKENLNQNVVEYTEVEHTTVNFVDDSNSIISFKDSTEMNYYLDRYMQVLKTYYNQMKLKINSEKTNIMIVSRNQRKAETTDLRYEDEKEVVIPKAQIRILGWIMNQRMSMNSNATIAISEVSRMLHNLRNLKHLMSEKTRLIIANSFMKSKLSYGLPLYVGANQNIKNKIKTCMMRVGRWVKGNSQFMIPNTKICKSIKWSTPNQMILQENMISIHKMLTENPIMTLEQELRKSRSTRKRTYHLKYKPKCEKMKRNSTYLGMKIYNTIPENLKTMKIKKFKKEIRKIWIKEPPIT